MIGCVRTHLAGPGLLLSTFTDPVGGHSAVPPSLLLALPSANTTLPPETPKPAPFSKKKKKKKKKRPDLGPDVNILEQFILDFFDPPAGACFPSCGFSGPTETHANHRRTCLFHITGTRYWCNVCDDVDFCSGGSFQDIFLHIKQFQVAAALDNPALLPDCNGPTRGNRFSRLTSVIGPGTPRMG